MEQQKTKPQRMIAAERDQQCCDLRRRHYSYREIAAELGISVGSAYNAVKRAMDRARAEATETAAEIIRFELERLDEMAKGLEPDAKSGDVDAVKAMLKIQERRSRLLGLDAPTKQMIGFMPHEEALAELDDPGESDA